MEQEHGTDAAAICKGVLLRIGMAAAMSTAVLGFLSYHVLPRLRKTDYIKMVSDADAQTALTLAPLVLLAICCLCVYPLIGHGKRSRADAAADAVRLVMVLPMSGMRISSAFAVPAIRSPPPIRVPADTMPATIRFSHVRIIGFPSPIPRNAFPTDGPRPVRTPRGGPDKKESFGDERPIGDATPPPIGGTPAWRAGTCVRRPDCRRHA